MSEIENDAAEDVSYEDNEKHVVRRRANGRATRLKILAAARAIIIEKGTDSLHRPRDQGGGSLQGKLHVPLPKPAGTD